MLNSRRAPRRPVTFLAAVLLLAPLQPVPAAPDLVVLGLFRDAAVVIIDGRQRTLRAGETTPEGVTLVEADSERAVLEVNGQRREMRMGSRITTGYEATSAVRVVRLVPDRDDMYTVSGSINGFSLRFVVDTGASAVAMNGEQARRIGIDVERTGVAGYADTPAGPVPTHQVSLDRVRVGEIELRDVGALVIEGPYPREALLGMTFLGRLDMRREGRMMELRTRP